MRKPHELVVELKSDVDLESLSRGVSLDIEGVISEATTNIVAAYFCIKGFKTLCSVLEHVVVTRMK